MKNNKGFSLVELIVVIAIMAILAAVAVAGLSIYIPKAQQAADNELLSVMSDALRAACYSEGVDPATVRAEIAIQKDGSMKTKGGKIDILLRTADGKKLEETTEATIATLFNQVVDAGEMFKLLNSGYAYYNGVKFEAKATSGLYNSVETNGFTITYDPERLLAYKDSFFGQMDQKDLLSDVDAAMDWASGHEGLWETVVTTDDFLNFVKDTFGKEYGAMTEDEQMSALVFYTANKSEKVDSDALIDNLIANNGSNMSTSDDDSIDIAGYAVQYALALAYYRENHPGEADPDVDTVLNFKDISNTGINQDTGEEETVYPYVDWLQQNGKQNMDGYLSAMDIITQNTGNISSDVLLGGFGGNTTLEGMLEDVLNEP